MLNGRKKCCVSKCNFSGPCFNLDFNECPILLFNDAIDTVIIDQWQIAVETFHQHITDNSILHAFSESCRVAKCNTHILCPLHWFGNIISDLHSGCNYWIHVWDDREK